MVSPGYHHKLPPSGREALIKGPNCFHGEDLVLIPYTYEHGHLEGRGGAEVRDIERPLPQHPREDQEACPVRRFVELH